MRRILSLKRHHYLQRVGIFLIAVALIAGIVSCNGTAPLKYDLTMAVNPVGGGTATDLTNASPYTAGTGVSIKAVAAAGYQFVSWSAPAGGFTNANEAQTTFTMPAQNVTVTANFVGPLDHFKWYLADGAESIDEVVYLEDQFCAVEAEVGYVVGFGNPAEKVHGEVTTPISNPDHHLTGYEIYYDEEPQTWSVEVENQFGIQQLTVSGPFGLAVPTQKVEPGNHEPPVGLDHYMVYEVIEGESVDVSVSLQDEFDGEPQESGVYEPMYFANPVKKTHGSEVTEILNPEDHLVFYYIDADFEGEVEVVNQFGEQTLDVYTFFGTGGLAVPSEKISWEKLEPPTALVIGTARDTNESLAVFEQIVAGPLMREFVEQVNLAGGVHLSAYDTATEECWVPLVIDRREINVATGDIEDVTQGICDDIAAGDVHFLWGGPGEDCILAQAPIANENEVVLLTFEGGAAYIANDPLNLAQWPYVFIPLSYSDWYQLPVLADMLEAELEVGDGAVKAYVVHIADEHGDDYLAVAEDNFDVVGDVEVPLFAGAMDAAEVVNDAMIALNVSGNNDDYDIFCCFAYPDHVFAITGEAMAQGFNPPAMVFGPGANFGVYPYMFGGDPLAEPPVPPDPCLVDGVMSFTVAAYDTNAEIQAVYDLIAERMDDDAGDPISGIPGFPGIFTLDYWGTPCYWAGMEMWLAAVEEVGYVDQELIRDALAAFEDDPVPTVLADETWFRMYGAPGEGGGNLDYLCHTGEIGQWQGCGTFETVGPVDEGLPVPGLPNYVVTANFTFPMTDLWNWLP